MCTSNIWKSKSVGENYMWGLCAISESQFICCWFDSFKLHGDPIIMKKVPRIEIQTSRVSPFCWARWMEGKLISTDKGFWRFDVVWFQNQLRMAWISSQMVGAILWHFSRENQIALLYLWHQTFMVFHCDPSWKGKIEKKYNHLSCIKIVRHPLLTLICVPTFYESNCWQTVMLFILQVEFKIEVSTTGTPLLLPMKHLDNDALIMRKLKFTLCFVDDIWANSFNCTACKRNWYIYWKEPKFLEWIPDQVHQFSWGEHTFGVILLWVCELPVFLVVDQCESPQKITATNVFKNMFLKNFHTFCCYQLIVILEQHIVQCNSCKVTHKCVWITCIFIIWKSYIEWVSLHCCKTQTLSILFCIDWQQHCLSDILSLKKLTF